jgi:hypothetical protein
MATFTGRMTFLWEVLQNDQYTLNGRTQTYIPMAAKVVGADRYNAQIEVLSAELSAQQITIAPLGVSAPGMILLFVADQPVDIRTNAASDTTFLSGVQIMSLTGMVSNLYITTGSAATTLQLQVVGGSNATLTTSLPVG